MIRENITFSVPGGLTDREATNFLVAASSLPEIAEAKNQGILPRNDAHYATHMDVFLELFVGSHPLSEDATNYDGVYLVGEPNWHEHIIHEIKESRELIEGFFGVHLSPLFIFIGNGTECNNLFRSIGNGYLSQANEAYPLSIAGGDCCFYNLDDVGDNFYEADRVRARVHEFTHAGVNNAIKQVTGVPNATDSNKVIHEACGGPERIRWLRAEIPRVHADFTSIEQLGFWDWYEDQCGQHGCDEPFFDNPVAQSFYLDYVNSKGNREFWFQKALNLALNN